VKALVAVLAAGLAIAPAAQARVLHVGPGQRYRKPSQAIAAARPGDEIQIDARGNGAYRGDVCAWSTIHLTIVGVHGRAHIDAAGQSSELKAIWVIAGNDTTIENIEFSGARVPDQNGAGDGFSHNIYVNHVRSFTLRYSYCTDARVGHLVKSRALRNYILYDRLTGEHGTDSYE
jgi:hypothetical protein